MTQRTYTITTTETARLIGKGCQYLAVAAYDHGEYQRNDIISWHKSYSAAAKAAAGDYRRVVSIHDVAKDAADTEYLEKTMGRML